MGDLLLINVCPLASRLDRDPARFVQIGDAGFGLEIGVFLNGRSIHSLDDHIGRAEADLDVAFADAIRIGDIVGAVGMELGDGR